MKLPFKQRVTVFGVVVWEGVKTEHTVGERNNGFIYVDLGNGYGSWAKESIWVNRPGQELIA